MVGYLGWHKGSKPGTEDHKVDPLNQCTFKVYDFDFGFIGTYHGYPESVIPADNSGRFQSFMNHDTNAGLSQTIHSIPNGENRMTGQSLYKQSLIDLAMQ